MSTFNEENNDNLYLSNNTELINEKIGRAKVWSPVAIKYISILILGYLSTFIFSIVNYQLLEHPKRQLRTKQLILIAILFIVLMAITPDNIIFLYYFS